MMPIYLYKCHSCGQKLDDFRSIENRDDSPLHCGVQMRRIITGCMVQPDIAGYRAIAVDKETGKRPYINSRKEHREFLLKNDYIEVGNQPFKETPEDQRPNANNIEFELPLNDL